MLTSIRGIFPERKRLACAIQPDWFKRETVGVDVSVPIARGAFSRVYG